MELNLNLSLVIALVALVAAAASLVWQRKATTEQRQMRAADEQAQLLRSWRETLNLTSRILALMMVKASQYARLETRLKRLLGQPLNPPQQLLVEQQLLRAQERGAAYRLKVEQSQRDLALLTDEGAAARSRDDYEALALTLTKAIAFLEVGQDEESQAIEDELAYFERQFGI